MRTAVIVALSLVVVAVVCLCGCPPRTTGPSGPQMEATAPPSNTSPGGTKALTGAALGEQIFTTGVGESGKHIAFSEGSERFASKPGGCALCHGEDGRGHKTVRGETPDITYATLRGGDKPLFPGDEAVIKAIREGMDEEAKPLAKAMPRWQITNEEAAALFEYLKTLNQAPADGKPEAKPDAKPDEKPAPAGG
ncbi:MAG: cytochrome c [Armatimonadetes bacterium]|nr:cytochrome c [Armatimonadota bacterium]